MFFYVMLQKLTYGFCFSLSVGVKQEDHDALLTEVQRLELELAKIRQELQAVAGCKGKCEQLDTLQETVTYSFKLVQSFMCCSVRTLTF